MVVYVIFGGMLATTGADHQGGLLMTCGVVITVLVLARTGLNLFSDAKAQTEAGAAYLKPGLMHPDAINGISFGLAFLLGTAGLPHILVRFFTVPDARAARKSVGWAVLLIGLFYVMIMVIGVGARAILGSGAEEASAGGNLAIPLLVEELGGGAGTVGGDVFLAVVSAIAFATILAVVAGLVISASGAMAHDLWRTSSAAGKARRARGDPRRARRGDRPRRARDHRRDRGGRGLQRLDPRRPGVRRGGERQPAGAAVRACSGRASTPQARWSACSAGSPRR